MVNTPIETLARKIRRWEEDPGAELSVMAQIGRRLLAGETLGAEVAPDYGVSGGTVSMVIRDMRKVGYRFRTQPGLTGGNSKVFTLTARPPFDFDLAPTPPAGPSSAPQPTPYRGPDSFDVCGVAASIRARGGRGGGCTNASGPGAPGRGRHRGRW